MNKEWEIKESKNFGKGVFATRTIEKWSKIVQLESEINVLEDFAIKNSCSKCLKRYENSSDLITCPKCSIINYCSNDCLESDEKYHGYECSWYHSVFSSLTPESRHICIPSRYQRFLMRFVSHLEINCTDSDLVDNCTELTPELLNQWMIEIEEIKCIVPHFATNKSMDDLIRFYGILKSNSYMMRHKNSGDLYGGQLIDVHSRINHSCDPNCVSSLDGTNVFLISLRKIEKGEELTVSYTDSSKPRQARKEYLKRNLFFDCKCSLCSSDEFEAHEALRTAQICHCGRVLLKLDGACSNCNSIIVKADAEKIFDEFDKGSSMDKFRLLKYSLKKLHECHWIINKMADSMIKEFCTEAEYTRWLPELLVDFKTGLIRGSETVSNPFTILVRYEYTLALINRNPDLYVGGLLIATNYLKLAARLKGVDDELAQKFALLSKKWSELLNKLKN